MTVVAPVDTAAPPAGDSRMLVALLVNPVAGMGGRVGLKGTDGVVEEARARGAEPVAPARATRMLKALSGMLRMRRGDDREPPVSWLTCGGDMGESAMKAAGFSCGTEDMVYAPGGDDTAATDTKAACAAFMEAGVDLLVFCGGDGTARDVLDAVGHDLPVLGIPSGVKMHSGVFAIDPSVAAEVILDFAGGRLGTAEVEVLDLDEERYRKGEWNIRLYGTVLTPYEPTLIQSGKAIFHGSSEDEMLEEIAEGVVEDMGEEPGTLYLLGAGGTLAKVGEELKLETSLLGIDAVVDGELVGRDLDEKGILDLLDRHPKARIILSPIGAQGFVLGRGNLQLSPEIIGRVGISGIEVLATPAKLARTPLLRVDTGDPELDAAFREKGHLFVTIQYRTRRLVPVK
jgi:predicted polyphosphate/ATP-dependent NAD kinase